MFQRVGKILLEPLQLLPTEYNISVLYVVIIVRENPLLISAVGCWSDYPSISRFSSFAVSLNLIIC